jgi:Flp pilus assembly protein TadD
MEMRLKMTSINENEALERAKSLFKHGFPRAAIDVLEMALREQPEAGSLWRLRAVLLQREGRRDEAFDNIQRARLLVQGNGRRAATIASQLAATAGAHSLSIPRRENHDESSAPAR